MNGTLGNANTVCDKKPWDDLNDGEKIERLREFVKGLKRENQILTRKLMTAECIIHRHQHGSFGETLVPANMTDQYAVIPTPDDGVSSAGAFI